MSFPGTAALRWSVFALGLLAAVSPAAAQWSRVTQVPASNVFSIYSNGDTIVAGADSSVFVSTDSGTSWHGSSKLVSGVAAIDGVLLRNGRLYAGTFGQGVFISDNLGVTWQAFNQGLVGGVANSQLQLSDFQVRGDSLYVGTFGAGVYVRTLVGAGTWSHFGDEFEPNQASTVASLALGGTRLLAAAGSNGQVFFRDPGDADWTLSSLDNVGLTPGAQAQSAVWNGSGWVVGTNVGVFRSVAGQEPWTPSGPDLGGLLNSAFATRGGRIFAAFSIVNNGVIEHSGDGGATWELLDVLPNVFVFKLAMNGTELYAGRADGLWRRSTAAVSVPEGGNSVALRFALAGPQPVGDDVRFRFELPQSGSASIDVFDVAGRRAADPVQGIWSAGTHEVSWSARTLSPGVYEARLAAAGRHEVVRLIRVR